MHVAIVISIYSCPFITGISVIGIYQSNNMQHSFMLHIYTYIKVHSSSLERTGSQSSVFTGIRKFRVYVGDSACLLCMF